MPAVNDVGRVHGACGHARHTFNVFFMLELAERVGFEFTRKRSFNNIERTAGTVKAMEDSGKQC